MDLDHGSLLVHVDFDEIHTRFQSQRGKDFQNMYSSNTPASLRGEFFFFFF